jgi:hypothetical protein
MNLRGTMLGLALFTLSAAFILSGFIVRSLRDRYTGGPYPRMAAFILFLVAGACCLIASIKFAIQT